MDTIVFLCKLWNLPGFSRVEQGVIYFRVQLLVLHSLPAGTLTERVRSTVLPHDIPVSLEPLI